LAFWSAEFWDDVSVGLFETEAFALALARYLGQSKVTRAALLQHLVTNAPSSLRRAIRYSQIFLFPHEFRWKEIKKLDLTGAEDLSLFLDACAIIQNEHSQLENGIKQIESELKRLSPMEVLVYSSLYAFKHHVLDFGHQNLTPYLTGKYAKLSPGPFQNITDAINQILCSKLKSSPDSDFFMSERILGESLRKHMVSLLFPASSAARAAEKCQSYLSAFERLVDAYVQLNEFVGSTINSFCFDEDYDIRFEEERLIVFPRVIPRESEWDRNGRKFERLHQYWLFRAFEEFIQQDLAFQTIGRSENEEWNRFAYISAIRIKLELTEIYGLDEEVTIDNNCKVNLFQALLTIELMHAFYKKDFILPYCKLYEQAGHWLPALTTFSFTGLVNGENRFPITFAERQAKIARISDWTRCEEWPNGNKKMTEAILDFWTNDLKELSGRLRQQKHVLQPELHERPIFKIGNYLFQLPWVFAFQNNVTAAVNNLRRLGNNRVERNSETQRIEQRLAKSFESFGFDVVGNFHPPLDADEAAGEIDLICFRENHLFIFEIKSGYIRKTQRDAWQHRTSTLRKAGLQLKRKSDLIIGRLKTDATLTKLIDNQDPDNIHVHCWIIDTSIEHDHEYFEGFLKVSLQEIMIALRNERHLLRDLQKAIAGEQQSRKEDNVGFVNHDVQDIYATAMASIREQNAMDNLYPDGFSARQFAAVIEEGRIWEILN